MEILTHENYSVPGNSLFQQPWWLDAVAPNQWGEVLVERNGDIIARLPYMLEKVKGFKVLTMPPLTQTLGPWLRPSQAKYANQLAEQKDMLTELIQQLPPFDYFAQNFHYSIGNWLPFYWQGFQQTTRYTYMLEDLHDEQALWDGLLPKIRTDIKKAQQRFQLHITSDLDIDVFLDANEQTFLRQGQQLPYSREFVKRLDAACAERKARRMFFAIDAEQRIHAAVYIVWDDHSAYYLMGGADPALRNSGATSLCLWEAIKFASTVTQRFDFEGSMVEAIERFFRAFGAKQTPYFRVTKINSRLLKIYRSLRR